MNADIRPQVLAKADAETRAGRPWRAKEILGGAIASGCTDAAVFEWYGQLLESLGDRVEAGKYLYLSGARSDAYSETIALFIARHAKRRGKDLVAQLPSAVRRQSFAALPAAVQEDLRRIGVDPACFGPARNVVASATPWRNRLTTTGLMVVAVAFLIAIVVGFRVIFSWVWNLFARLIS